MPRNYGVEYPERPLMAVLSDLLGIRHFSTSRGATVRSDFLREVLTALGEDPTGLSKDQLIRACVEVATGDDFDPGLISVGGTVTNQALQAMIDGITRRGLGVAPPNGDSLRPDLVFAEADVDYDPEKVADERERRLAERAVRQGQDVFRTRVLEAYAGQCAVTGSNAVGALEAAHITPYRGPRTNVIGNGICLRADLHRLWDNGLIALDETKHEVLLDETLLATTYAELRGRRARLPRYPADRPSTAALTAHRQWCGLQAG